MENLSSSGAAHEQASLNFRQLRDRNTPRRVVLEADLTIPKVAAELQACEPQVSSSRKRRRSVLSSPVRTQKQAASRNVPLGNRRYGLPEPGPSDALSFFSDPSEPASKGRKALAFDDCDSPTSSKARVSIAGANDALDGVNAQLEGLKQCLRDAEAQLDKERSQRFESERQVRQDMYLEMLQAKEISQRSIEKLERHLRIAGKLMDERDETARELRARFECTSENLARQVVEIDSQRQELQHLQGLNTTLEGDIEELRQLQNEAPAAKRPSGLPPAYGSLDEEDLPPYELHKDNGALSLATFKRAVRETFNLSARQAPPCYNGSQFSIEPTASPGVQTFHQTSHALYAAVSKIGANMERWPDFSVDLMLKGSVHRYPTPWSFLAARLANLILELLWRTVALNEVRPASRDFSARALSVQLTMYSHVDDVLLQAIRHWNGAGTTNSTHVRSSGQQDYHRAAEFQVYLSQLTALASRLRHLLYTPRNKRELLTKSISFLQEAVENERMQEANRSPDRNDEPRSRDPSVISSVGLLENGDSEDDGV